MNKKRGDKAICKNLVCNKQAQITVFMILGLILLFIFIILFSVTSEFKKSELEQEKEQVLSKTFKKEALRIYVEDCLNDELERGLTLLGKQGRIWSDQPGGTKKFQEKFNGVNYQPQDKFGRISYSISKQEYLEHENAYPCEENISLPPQYCEYKYPDTQLGYGYLDLKTSTIKTDLKRFLLNRTVWCVHNFTRTNISKTAEIQDSQIDLSLDILNDGINVEVEYPLKMKIGSEEFFHISKFDFFYPTQFKWLLESAVVRPLLNEWKYLDFNYTNQTLQSNYYLFGSKVGNCPPYNDYLLCNGSLFFDKYQSLSIKMEQKELPDGDDLFIFTSPKILNLPGYYQFRVVRQNRPPALDYVERRSCPSAGYDYLIIKDENSSLGDVNISLFALDPDEDNLTFTFEEASWDPYTIKEQQQLYISNEDVNNDFTEDFYEFTAKAKDEHGLEDWQKVRVLVDRPFEVNVSLSLPYIVNGISYSELFTDNFYTISNEDPVFINITLPEDSKISGDHMVTLIYNNSKENFQIDIPYDAWINKKACLPLPLEDVASKCTIDNYDSHLENWPEKINDGTFLFPYFAEVTDSDGQLNLSFSMNYCLENNNHTFGNSKSLRIKVAQCIPHQNDLHPWAAPYHNVKVNKTSGEYFGEEEISPLLATHSCCDTLDWTIKDENSICYQSEVEKGCFAGSEQAAGIGQGYLLEERTFNVYCDGERGNYCGGEKNFSYIYKNRCGNQTLSNCNKVAKICESQIPFSTIQNDDGTFTWCNGASGCGINQVACSTMVVDTNADGNIGFVNDKCTFCSADLKDLGCINLRSKETGTCQEEGGDYECI